jgi:hypothetical protein
MILIVDTNVPVVANGNSPQAGPMCVEICIQRIRSLNADADVLALDDGWRIIKEYQGRLRSEGQPGIGDRFLKWVLTNIENPRRCHQVAITPVGDSETDFQEFPDDLRLEKFDPSDRKFVAVARAHPKCPPILTAVDTDWLQFNDILEENEIKVEFLCLDDLQQLNQRKARRSRKGRGRK